MEMEQQVGQQAYETGNISFLVILHSLIFHMSGFAVGRGEETKVAIRKVYVTTPRYFSSDFWCQEPTPKRTYFSNHKSLLFLSA